MKKIIKFIILMSVIFLYLIHMFKIQNHHIEMAIVIGYFEGIMRIALGICGGMFTYNTMKIKINNKANFMSISALIVSVFIILQMGVYVQYSHYILLLGVYQKGHWMIEFLQIISLIICINYIDQYTNLKIWSIAYSAICCIGILFVCSPFLITLKTLSYDEGILLNQGMSISCILLASIAYGMNHKKIIALLPFERRVISGLFWIKISVNTLTALNAIDVHYSIKIICMIAQIIFSLLIVAYIEELTLSITWKKIDLGVQRRGEQATKGNTEQRTLIVAAGEIRRIIQNINKETCELEMQIVADSSTKYRKYIDKIINNCHRLLKLSMNILDLNSYEDGRQHSRFEFINLTALIGDVVESLETYIMQKSIQIIYMTSNECIIAEVDKEAIERLFLNLLSNAIKYNRVNGTIKVILTEKKKKIYLCIQDTGIGIPSHSLDLVFEKFQRVNAGLARDQEGSGLGLSIVKSLVDIHHGEIKIVSEENKGTLISIGLPKVQEKKIDTKKCKKRHQDSLNEKIKVEFSDIDLY